MPAVYGVRERTRQLAGAGLILTVVLAGCSSDSDAATTTSTVPPPSATTTTTTTLVLITPLVVGIVSPVALSTYSATVDLGDGRLAAPVRLTAEVETPPGEAVTVSWSSDLDGPLGEGLTLDAQLSNDGRDIVTHLITATATASGGGTGAVTLLVLVQVPSN